MSLHGVTKRCLLNLSYKFELECPVPMDPLVAMAIIAGSILFLGLLILLLLKIALIVYERMEYKQFLKDQKLMQYQV